ncbi:hypothetical protein APR12_002167 [Nocardia amikacinitolerans]|nr:hypothetical protein [Nocardia amikacinitolerans]
MWACAAQIGYTYLPHSAQQGVRTSHATKVIRPAAPSADAGRKLSAT